MTKSWATTASSGDWGDINNWTPPGLPRAVDDVVIGDLGPQVPMLFFVELSRNARVHSLTLGGAGVLDVGYSFGTFVPAPAALTITDGGHNEGLIHIWSQGRMTLSGVLTNTGSNLGTIEIDARTDGAAGLVLNGATIDGGAITLGKSGSVPGVLLAASGCNTIENASIANRGKLKVSSGAQLELLNTSVSGGTILTLNECGCEFSVLLANAAIADATLNAFGPDSFEILSGYRDNALTNVTLLGDLWIDDGSTLTLRGAINNQGSINIDACPWSAAGSTDLFIAGSVTLSGWGLINLSDSSTNHIEGGSLDNINNAIVGAGLIENGRLINETKGLIAASGCNPLLIHTATTVVNHGELASLSSLQIEGDLLNDGYIFAGDGSGDSGTLYVSGAVTGGGYAFIGDGQLELGGAADCKVDFLGPDAGLLTLDDAHDFTGIIGGLGADGNQSIDLGDVSFATLTKKKFIENAQGTSGHLKLGTASDYVTLTLIGDYANNFHPAPGAAGFVLSDDGTAAHGTLVQYFASAPT